MKQTRDIMGMPVTVEIADAATEKDLEAVFSYFEYVDEKFSTYKTGSEISKINRREITEQDFSADMKVVLALSGQTKKLTRGYFDIQTPDGHIDPSGLVKGWAIHNASQILKDRGFKNFYVEAGGDIEAAGKNAEGKNWVVGIRSPFNMEEIVKVIEVADRGVATSGTYIRGQHIYNPKSKSSIISDIMSLTVIGPNIYEADRFATAAFAMGKQGILFIENLGGFEGFMIDKDGIGTETTGFKEYVI